MTEEKEEKKEGLYETLFKISKGDVELFKDEAKHFVMAVTQHTGAAAKMQRTKIESEKPQPTDTAAAA